MSIREESTALRTSATFSRMGHVRHLRLRGTRVREALDRLIPRELFLHDGQLLHSLLLDEAGRIFGDVYLGCDDEEFVLLAEGPTASELADHVRRHAGGTGVDVEDRSESHALVAIDGPYAWEVLAALAGDDVIGLPYLTLFHFDGGTCFRAGKTGEYGYGILVRRGDADALWERLVELAPRWDAAVAGLETLDLAALENWFFNVRREGRESVTPIELQLQWRVSYHKDYVGSEALARRRSEGPGERLTCLVASQPLEQGSAVELDGEHVGRIVNASFSWVRDEWVALGLIAVRCAHPGIDGFRVKGAQGIVCARSVRPPLLNNRSLYVSPQLHSYATRHEVPFPPLTGAR